MPGPEPRLTQAHAMGKSGGFSAGHRRPSSTLDDAWVSVPMGTKNAISLMNGG
jgi:hypothetical protein